MNLMVETSDTIVVAVGGNAIIDPKSRGTMAEQKETTQVTMRAVARLIASGHRVVLTHGNGPIVGNIVIRNEAASDRISPMPLDVCVADSCGGIGYMVQQTLGNELLALGVDRSVITLITQVEVDLADPAFLRPTKPIGPFYKEKEVEALRREKGWIMIEDSGRGWRRVVPSPKPVRVVEGELVRSLVETGAVVIAVGGGGIPVRRDAEGRLEGVEAVVDKDRAAVLLARAVDAKILAVLTGVPKVAIRYGKPDQQDLDRLTLSEARRHHEAGEFPAGSMGPKMEAAARFLERGGREVLVCAPENLAEALVGEDGTRIAP